MTNAIRQTVRVKPGGLIEIRSPELTPGTLAEVIVLIEPSEEQSARAARVRELAALFKATQSLPQAQAISEDEIAQKLRSEAKFKAVSEISGIYDITGGLDAAEYIRRMRDAR